VRKVLKGGDRLFVGIGNTIDGVNPNNNVGHKVFNPTPRVQEYREYDELLLRCIEYASSQAYGTISTPPQVVRTATEVVSAKRKNWFLVKKCQNALEAAITQLVTVMSEMSTAYGLSPVGDYDIDFKFDDSLSRDFAVEIQQRQAEFNEITAMFARGLVSDMEARKLLIDKGFAEGLSLEPPRDDDGLPDKDTDDADTPTA
jgi:hypothetical protein